MGTRNVLVEGVSGTGKTSVARELQRRGFHAVNGDTELAYQGDPRTGEPTGTRSHDHHLWDVQRVRAIAAGQEHPVTCFCGGSRNHAQFLDVFDVVMVLEIDRETLERRLDERPADAFGGRGEERDLVRSLHRTGEGLPEGGTRIDATAPLAHVVDEVLRLAGAT